VQCTAETAARNLHVIVLTLFPLPCILQGPNGAIKIAAAAGSALQPLAVVLLEAASLDQLAASKAEDWQVIERSAATQVPGCLPAGLPACLPQDATAAVVGEHGWQGIQPGA
jgi:hypothetical protein